MAPIKGPRSGTNSAKPAMKPRPIAEGSPINENATLIKTPTIAIEINWPKNHSSNALAV